MKRIIALLLAALLMVSCALADVALRGYDAKSAELLRTAAGISKRILENACFLTMREGAGVFACRGQNENHFRKHWMIFANLQAEALDI